MDRVFVYFILNFETGEIKIGQSKNPLRRLEQLKEEEKVPLALLGTIEDVVPLEKKLHKLFESFRTRGEWFKVNPVLFEYISKLNGNRCISHERSRSPTVRKDSGFWENSYYIIVPLAQDKFRVECKLCEFTMDKPTRKTAALSGNSHCKIHDRIIPVNFEESSLDVEESSIDTEESSNVL